MTTAEKHMARFLVLTAAGGILGAWLAPAGYKSVGAGLGLFGTFVVAQSTGLGLYA